MPRYFFDVHDGQDLLDHDGHELPDLDAARHEAVRCAGQLIEDLGLRFWDGTDWSMVVREEAGPTLFTLRFVGTSGTTADA